MVNVAFVAPHLIETTSRFLEAAARLPGVDLALITTEPADRVPVQLGEYLAAHWRVDDALDPRQIADAVQGLGVRQGPVHRVIGVHGALQVPLAQVREHLGIEGNDVATAHNFRDGARGESLLRVAGVPSARHGVTEGSFDSVLVNGTLVWRSVTHYLRNVWTQPAVLMPGDIGRGEYAELEETALVALKALGLNTGMTHLGWSRRPDGTIAVSEVALHPPGAGICSMLCHAHDFDIYGGWAGLVVYGSFDPPRRASSVGTVFLRGQGTGVVRRVCGLDTVLDELGSVVVGSRLPQPGQLSSSGDEGDGYVMVRHDDTTVVTEALRRLANDVRVELG